VTFTPSVKVQNKDLTILDNHYGKECKILKMAQVFELDKTKPAEEQYRRTEFNYRVDKGSVNIYYHFREGQITAKSETFVRDDLIGKARLGDINEKDDDEDKQSQINKKIIKLEQDCHEEIK
jgi:hypothetical protein